jgi:allophanate hydrolase
MAMSLQFAPLRGRYRAGQLTPVETIDEVYRRIDVRGTDHVWTGLADRVTVREQAHALAQRIGELDALPLYGLPFGVKDNVHVAGVPTTCGCPGYTTVPTQTAEAVRRAIAAGAIFIGKQSLDQFATGLNGTRTLGGHCLNTFDPEIIPGGSSSGSGVAVAAGLVSFSLGSDTGGSGRVPAALNNIVGLRPTIGLVSTRGMVYNNRMFDCIPVFALTVDDAFTVLEAIAGRDMDDPVSRADADGIPLKPDFPQTFRFAIPERLEFFGDKQSATDFERAVAGLSSLGGTPCVFDFEPFHEAGQLIFESALVAERAASYGEVLDSCAQDLVPAVASILTRARRYSAVEAFQAHYRLSALRRQVASMLDGIDVVVTPTVPRPFRVSEMLADPITRNAEVGFYTYGVGPLDLCAISVPSRLRDDGLPFGISLVARAGAEASLRALGARFEQWTGQQSGARQMQ